mmetsp:Transcript_20467/g.60957  ORF Transcript_20467/g.60957 Transcript_20467/m.60957 type:complete len:206 (+) Transcript_20467:1487-2104(+)
MPASRQALECSTPAVHPTSYNSDHNSDGVQDRRAPPGTVCGPVHACRQCTLDGCSAPSDHDSADSPAAAVDSLDCLVQEHLDGRRSPVTHDAGNWRTPPSEEDVVKVVLPHAQEGKAKCHKHCVPVQIQLLVALHHQLRERVRDARLRRRGDDGGGLGIAARKAIVAAAGGDKGRGDGPCGTAEQSRHAGECGADKRARAHPKVF